MYSDIKTYLTGYLKEQGYSPLLNQKRSTKDVGSKYHNKFLITSSGSSVSLGGVRRLEKSIEIEIMKAASKFSKNDDIESVLNDEADKLLFNLFKQISLEKNHVAIWTDAEAEVETERPDDFDYYIIRLKLPVKFNAR